jgi:hypothetical protein
VKVECAEIIRRLPKNKYKRNVIDVTKIVFDLVRKIYIIETSSLRKYAPSFKEFCHFNLPFFLEISFSRKIVFSVLIWFFNCAFQMFTNSLPGLWDFLVHPSHLFQSCPNWRKKIFPRLSPPPTPPHLKKILGKFLTIFYLMVRFVVQKIHLRLLDKLL